MEKLEWTALEYEDKERTPDWFWALGVIVVASSLAAIIYENYFFATLIILSGVLLAFFAKKKPDTVSYSLTDRGLRIRSRLYPYDNIRAFWIQLNHPEHPAKEFLFIRSERIFMPIISIPIDQSLAKEIKEIMHSKGVPEEEMHEHPAERIMDSLGF